MVKLEFTNVIPSIADLRKKGKLVIIDKYGEVWIGHHTKQDHITAIFNGVECKGQLDSSTFPKIYLFGDSTDISKTLDAGGCLDRFLYKPEDDKVAQVFEWLKVYPFVGHIYDNGEVKNKRHTVLEGTQKLKSVRFDGNAGSTWLHDHLKDSSRYCDFVGFSNLYDGYKWLNS